MSNSQSFIVANGNQLPIELPCRLADFLTKSGWKATQVVVELNGEVISRSRVGEIGLQSGDRIEVIVPVAGG